MEIELIPEPDDRAAAAVTEALAEAQIDPSVMPEPYRSNWRRAALAEGAERAPAPDAPGL